MILSENRLSPRIESGAGFFRISLNRLRRSVRLKIQQTGFAAAYADRAG
jgi:hypothetical protein